MLALLVRIEHLARQAAAAAIVVNLKPIGAPTVASSGRSSRRSLGDARVRARPQCRTGSELLERYLRKRRLPNAPKY